MTDHRYTADAQPPAEPGLPRKATVFAQLRTGFLLLLVLTVLTGVAYPLAMLVLARALFPDSASGSLLVDHGQVVGSRLIGQAFGEDRFFWGRPSATAPTPYDAGASNGSNLGPFNPALRAAVQVRVAALRAADPGNRQLVPVDLVTASASGLDPDISLAAAKYQIARVARARGLAPTELAALIDSRTTGRQLGLLGEPRVNVLDLNRALERLTIRSDGGAAQ